MSENVPAEAAAAAPPPPAAAAERQDTAGRKKRGAERQITKDDYADDDDDEGEEEEEVRENAFQRASADVLKKRRIVKATRPIASTSTSAKPSSNPFARVHLQPSTTTTTAATAPKVFGATTSFSGFGAAKATTGSSSSTGFGSSSSSGFGTSTAASGGLFGSTSGGFGTTTGAAKSSSTGLSFGTAKGFGQVTTAASSPSSGFGTSTTNTGVSAVVTTSSSDDKKEKESPEQDGSKEKDATEETAAADSPGNGKDAASSPAGSPTSPAAMTLPPVAVLPKEYELKSGEEDETILLELRCRTHKWVTKSSKADEEAATEAAAREKVAAVPASESALGSIADKKDMNDTKEAAGTTTKKASTSTQPGHWQEVGVGQLRVLRHEGLGRVRLVQRRQLTPTGLPTKVILNAPLWKESAILEEDPSAATATNNVAEKYVKVVTICEGKTVILLFKFKLASEAAELKTLLEAERLRAQSLEQQTTSATTAIEGTTTTDDDANKQQPSSTAEEATKSPAKEDEEGKVTVDSSKKEVGAKEEAAQGDEDPTTMVASKEDVDDDSKKKNPAS